MRVGLIGNMNNNHFVLARYLRDAGIDAYLLPLAGEFSHFHPSCDSFDLDYQRFTRPVKWGSQHDLRTCESSVIRQDLAPYDLLIGTGLAPAFCQKVDRSLDIFVPYGFDLIHDPMHYKMPHHFMRHFKSVRLQRKGMARSKVVSMPACPHLYESLARRFMPASERWFTSIPLVYSPDYSSEKLEENFVRSQWGWAFKKLRAESEFLVFMSGRHVWKCSSDNPNHKGNDAFLHGWSDFVDRNPGRRLRLVAFEYGDDFMETQRLAKELAIDHTMSWFPMMHRKEILMGLSNSDLACGDFTHSWLAGGVTYEALSLGVPIIKYRDDQQHQDHPGELYEMINARTSQGIAEGLQWALDSKSDLKAMGHKGQEWYEREIVQSSTAQFINYISSQSQ